MNPKRLFDKIVKYVEDVSSDSERELEEDSFIEADNVISSARDEVRESNLNIFKAILKNKGVLSGVDFCAVMSKSQGKGAKELKGVDLKRHLNWKEQVHIVFLLFLETN